MRAVAYSLVQNHVVFAGGEKEVCFLLKYVTLFKVDQQVDKQEFAFFHNCGIHLGQYLEPG